MSLKKEITPFQLEVLKEIGNIGAGHAATALSTLLNKKISMRIPDVRIVSFDEMLELAGGSDAIVASVFLRIEGDASGNMFFTLPLEQATLLVQKLTGDQSFSFDHPPFPELALSAMEELGNILMGSYISSLSDFTGLSLYPSVPSISIDMAGAIISYGLIEISQTQDYALVIDTALEEKNDLSLERVHGHFFLIPDPHSFPIIFTKLGVGTE